MRWPWCGKDPHIPFILVSGTIGEQAAIESLKRAQPIICSSRIRTVAFRRSPCRAGDGRAGQASAAETELIRREKYFRTSRKIRSMCFAF